MEMKLRVAVSVAMTASAVFAKTLTIGPIAGNATPHVAAAVMAMADGDTLLFKKGEYHFDVDGAHNEYVVSSGCKNGDKRVVFSLRGKKDVTIDGGGSTFIWHGRTFPFHCAHCPGLVLRNFESAIAGRSVVEPVVTEKSPEGFLCKFADPKCYSVQSGNIVFDLEIGRFTTAERKISVHALDRCNINYLFAGDSTCPKVNLPASFVETDAEDRGDGCVFFRYRKGSVPFPYGVGSPIGFLLEIPRFRCTLFIEHCHGATVRNVSVRRGGGIALTAQCCNGLTLDGFNVRPYSGEKVANTADCIFLVNCRGQVVVKDCEISWSLDDAMNCHGNYFIIESVRGRTARVRHVLQRDLAYEGFFPFHAGDVVEFTHPGSRADVLGTAVVESLQDCSTTSISATLTFKDDVSKLPAGTYVENITWIPNVTVTGCHFHDTLHLRLSGRGNWIVENNRFSRGAGVLVEDLSSYWGEAGRTENMKIRNNVFNRFNSMGGGAFVTVSGQKIHRGIEVIDNHYSGGNFLSLNGAIDPVARGNVKE